MGNNLIFIESLFWARRCADSSLNINSALNLYRNLEKQKQTVFPFTIEDSSSERLVTCPEFTQLQRAEQGSGPGFLPLLTLVFLGLQSRRYLMLEYGALGKALETVNCKQPERNGRVKTNKKLEKI